MEKLVNRFCFNSLRILCVLNLVIIKFFELLFIEKIIKIDSFLIVCL